MNFECLSKERLVVLIHQLLHLERSHYHKEAKNCAFKSILHEIHHANFRDHDKTIASKIEIINQWIHANFANDVDYHSVANYLGYNKDYLNKYYKSQTGMTINQKITHTRLMHAKSFLSESNKSIKEIAFEVGFKDVKFFMKKFKEQEMLTPTSYRKCFYKKHINTK